MSNATKLITGYATVFIRADHGVVPNQWSIH